jgi:hypothetical protein
MAVGDFANANPAPLQNADACGRMRSQMILAMSGWQRRRLMAENGSSAIRVCGLANAGLISVVCWRTAARKL